LYYEFRRDDSINYNSNTTNDSSMNENNIWNDPYSLLRTLIPKLESLRDDDNEDYKNEISETIKNALNRIYTMVYVNKQDVNVDELSDLFSGTKI